MKQPTRAPICVDGAGKRGALAIRGTCPFFLLFPSFSYSLHPSRHSNVRQLQGHAERASFCVTMVCPVPLFFPILPYSPFYPSPEQGVKQACKCDRTRVTGLWAMTGPCSTL